MLYYIYVITSLDHQARVKFLCLVTLMFNNLEKLTVLHTSVAMALLVPTWTTSSELLSPHYHSPLYTRPQISMQTVFRKVYGKECNRYALFIAHQH